MKARRPYEVYKDLTQWSLIALERQINDNSLLACCRRWDMNGRRFSLDTDISFGVINLIFQFSKLFLHGRLSQSCDILKDV